MRAAPDSGLQGMISEPWAVISVLRESATFLPQICHSSLLRLLESHLSSLHVNAHHCTLWVTAHVCTSSPTTGLGVRGEENRYCPCAVKHHTHEEPER